MEDAAFIFAQEYICYNCCLLDLLIVMKIGIIKQNHINDETLLYFSEF